MGARWPPYSRLSLCEIALHTKASYKKLIFGGNRSNLWQWFGPTLLEHHCSHEKPRHLQNCRMGNRRDRPNSVDPYKEFYKDGSSKEKRSFALFTQL